MSLDHEYLSLYLKSYEFGFVSIMMHITLRYLYQLVWNIIDISRIMLALKLTESLRWPRRRSPATLTCLALCQGRVTRVD